MTDDQSQPLTEVSAALPGVVRRGTPVMLARRPRLAEALVAAGGVP